MNKIILYKSEKIGSTHMRIRKDHWEALQNLAKETGKSIYDVTCLLLDYALSNVEIKEE